MVRAVKDTLGWIAAHTPEQVVQAAALGDAAGSQILAKLLRENPRMYSRDGRFSARQLKETEIFFQTRTSLLLSMHGQLL